MEIAKATIDAVDEMHYIRIESGAEEIRIPMSEDQPNEIKGAFNKLIERIRDGAFQIELETEGEDLFSQVADEYIRQLNQEIGEVFDEMKQHDLLKKA